VIRTSGLPAKYGKVLFNLAAYYKFTHILELGTSVGTSTLYMSMAYPDSKVLTIEGSKERAEFASDLFNQMGLSNIEVHIGNFTEELNVILRNRVKFDLVFIDGDHTEKAVLKNFYHLHHHLHEKSIVILDDIHLSSSMERAWRKILRDDKVTLTIDLFRLGIIFFDTKLSKQNLIINY